LWFFKSAGYVVCKRKIKKFPFIGERNTTFEGLNSIIPYEICDLDGGGNFDCFNGVFTVPKTGVWYFYFSALKLKKDSNDNELYVHLVKLGQKVLKEAFIDVFDNNGGNGIYLQMQIYLEKGAKIAMELVKGNIYGEGKQITTFMGHLLEF